MKRKHIILIVAILAAGVGAGVVASYYLGDHTPPELKVVSSYEVVCGNPVAVGDLVEEVLDQSQFTLSLSGDGTVSKNGKRIIFDKAGEHPVQVKATDSHGRSTTRTVPVTARDETVPELEVRDIVAELGEEIDYADAITAIDASDGDLSEKVEVDDSRVDRDELGTYTVFYSVRDAAGNRAQAQGQVIIQPVQATQIVLDQTDLSLSGNQHMDLHATVSPENWAGTVEWSSDNPDVATVSDGMVAWAGEGACVITAQADGQSATCRVTCEKVMATSIQLSRTELTLSEGESATLTVDTSPSNWKGEVIWTSSNPGVATVQQGVVTGIAQGECTITASTGTVENSCRVTCRRTVLNDMSDMWHDFVDRQEGLP